METGYGVLEYTEKVLQEYVKINADITYKVNKINILVKNINCKNAIMDIYGRIRNDEIRICINADDSEEYRVYKECIEKQIDTARAKRESKGFLNYSFYVSRNNIDRILTTILGARK